MRRIRHKQQGFSGVETLLVIIFVMIVGFTAWYVAHAKRVTDKSLDATSKTSQSGVGTTETASGGNGTDDHSLQNDLNGINSTDGQASKDLSATSSGLNDNSTFTSLPQ